ncbi:putative mitochondrial ribosomal protein of the small subunit [Nadsonia fulvescens var. elongata DSM 6958]|uniref:Putative mitochondrial ribosomal protein of the small subunit n=1 Tax=Nadsonia fulvescens var. elongata DSM 6958 TaxID=857566 RepID=A0A1E3PJE3_9ASCO|nr:putative mitochondrial ribosomal protein of the small subunit [Nadsonia fulvescens var. elongata DSM 6958]
MAVHILGKSFRGNALISYGIAQKFFGIGFESAKILTSKLGFYPKMRMHQLTETQVLQITKELTGLTIENDLKKEIRANIALKKAIGSYAGRRHALSLPVRGQGTRNNAKTARKLNRSERF